MRDDMIIREEIIKIAKETLEGNLRGVLSQLTPEQVNEDKITFAEKLLHEADVDLSKLGLELDTLKIQKLHLPTFYLLPWNIVGQTHYLPAQNFFSQSLALFGQLESTHRISQQLSEQFLSKLSLKNCGEIYERS